MPTATATSELPRSLAIRLMSQGCLIVPVHSASPNTPRTVGCSPMARGTACRSWVRFQHAWCSSQIADLHYPCGPEEACKKMLKMVSNLQNTFLLQQSIVPPTGWHVGTESDMTCQPGISAEMLLSCAARADGRVSPHLRHSWFCKGCFS